MTRNRILQKALLRSLADDLKPVDEKGRWKPSPLLDSRVAPRVRPGRRLLLLHARRAAMSPTYDQPRRYQTGPEDVAGILVLFGCAVARVLLVRRSFATASSQRPVSRNLYELRHSLLRRRISSSLNLSAGVRSGRRTGRTRRSLSPEQRMPRLHRTPTRTRRHCSGITFTKSPGCGPTL